MFFKGTFDPFAFSGCIKDLDFASWEWKTCLKAMQGTIKRELLCFYDVRKKIICLSIGGLTSYFWPVRVLKDSSTLDASSDSAR